jgi:hypothetical protein
VSGPRVSPLTVGVDVPWVTSWSEEAVTGVAPCPSVDGVLALAQQTKPGLGKPLYSRNHLFRQRLSVRSMLCPMCGEPTAEDDRWTQTGHYIQAREVRAMGLGAFVPAQIKDDDRLLDAGAIAPLHRACAENAVAHCPHLGGLEDTELKPFPGAWLVIPLTVEVNPPPGPDRRPRPPVAVVSFLQLLGIPDD